MVSEDAAENHVLQEADVGLVPRFTAVQSPEKLFVIDHDDGIV